MTTLRAKSQVAARVAMCAGVLAGSVAGCSLSDFVDTDLPSNVNDPDAIKTSTGAISLYNGVITQFRDFTTGHQFPGGYVVASGLLSDELTSGQYNTLNYPNLTPNSAIDSRNLSETGVPSDIDQAYEAPWRGLNGVRTGAMTAIGALRAYAPEAPRDYIGHAFALWGIAETMIAQLYCSGTPMSTVAFEQPYVLDGPRSTTYVLEHAVAMFDSALANTPDSASVRNLARVGKGWALLHLNRYPEAAAAVQEVPTSFVYANYHTTSNPFTFGGPSYTIKAAAAVGSPLANGFGTVADREGANGLPYRSSGDPRTASSDVGFADVAFPTTIVYAPNRWTRPTPGGEPVVMASGVEARLIEAEAALKAGTASWLTTLNALRNDGTFTVSGTDTTWGAGTGSAMFRTGLPGLPTLADPGAAPARVDLLFRERAFWLFLTGRRLGDMRRLVRQYGRPANTVFPIGAYQQGPLGAYGSDMNLPVPNSERRLNVKFTGCLNRDA